MFCIFLHSCTQQTIIWYKYARDLSSPWRRTQTHMRHDKPHCCRFSAHAKPPRAEDPESSSSSTAYFKCRSEHHKCQQVWYRLCLHVSSLELAKAHTLQTLKSWAVSKLTASNAEKKTSYPYGRIHSSPFLHLLKSLSCFFLICSLLALFPLLSHVSD